MTKPCSLSILSIVAALTLATPASFAAESPAVAALMTFEKAVQLQDTENDAAGAAALYEKLTGPEVPAAVRAEAEVRHAQCLLKLGKTEAAQSEMAKITKRLRGDRAAEGAKAKEIAARSGGGEGKNQPNAPTDNPSAAKGAEVTEQSMEDAFEKLLAIGVADRGALVAGAIDGMAKAVSKNAGFVAPREMITGDSSLVGIGTVLSGGERIEIREIVAGSPAEKAGLVAGSEIMEVNGKTIFALGGKLTDVIAAVRGPEGSRVTLRLKLPDGQILEKEMSRARIEIKAPKAVRPLLGDSAPNAWWVDEAAGIAGIEITRISRRCSTELNEALAELVASKKPLRGLILDLSENGGGSPEEATEIVDTFLNEGVIFTKKDQKKEEVMRAKAGEQLAGVPLVVLVSGRTASAAEIITAALQDNRRATVIGQRTYGRGVASALVSLKGGGHLRLPVWENLRPNGKGLERHEGMTEQDAWGVTPDKLVAAPPIEEKRRPAQIEAARKALLNAALEHFRTLNAGK